MLSVNIIEKLVTKLKLDDFDLRNVSSDSNIDYISIFDPDTDFSTVRKAVIENKVINKKVQNQGINFVELFDTEWVDGNKVSVAERFEVGDSGFGTTVKIMTKTVNVLYGGSMKTFLSFSDYNNYKDLIGV